MTRCSIECARKARPGAPRPHIRYFVENALRERLYLPEPAARSLAHYMARQTKVGAQVLTEDGRVVARYRWTGSEVVEVERSTL